MSELFTCPGCGHAAVLPEGLPAAFSLLTCDECGCKIAYGERVNVVTINPDPDPRWLLVSFDELDADKKIVRVTHRIPRAYAKNVAMNILSVCP